MKEELLAIFDGLDENYQEFILRILRDVLEMRNGNTGEYVTISPPPAHTL